MAEEIRTTIIPMVPYSLGDGDLLAKVTVIEAPGKPVYLVVSTHNANLTMTLERPVADAIAAALRSHHG